MDELLPPELTARPSKMIGMEDDPFHFEMVTLVNFLFFFLKRNLLPPVVNELIEKKKPVDSQGERASFGKAPGMIRIFRILNEQ